MLQMTATWAISWQSSNVSRHLYFNCLADIFQPTTHAKCIFNAILFLLQIIIMIFIKYNKVNNYIYFTKYNILSILIRLVWSRCNFCRSFALNRDFHHLFMWLLKNLQTSRLKLEHQSKRAGHCSQPPRKYPLLNTTAWCVYFCLCI